MQRDQSLGTHADYWRQKLNHHHIRVTAKRLAVISCFNRSCHMKAEEVKQKLSRSGVSIALATIYNALNLFAEKGLLKKVTLASGAAFFDSNTEEHYHLQDKKTGKLIDIPVSAAEINLADSILRNRNILRIHLVIEARSCT